MHAYTTRLVKDRSNDDVGGTGGIGLPGFANVIVRPVATTVRLTVLETGPLLVGELLPKETSCCERATD